MLTLIGALIVAIILGVGAMKVYEWLVARDATNRINKRKGRRS